MAGPTKVATPRNSLPAVDVCAGHEALTRNMETMMVEARASARDNREAMDRLVDKVDRLADKVEGVRVEQARTSEAVTGLRERIAGVEGTVDEVTEIGIKTRRGDSSTSHRRPSTDPARRGHWPPPKWAVGIGVGLVVGLAVLGFWIGVFSATGSAAQASGAVRAVVAPAAQAATTAAQAAAKGE